LVVLLNRRDPMALHCPVIELAPVPGRPMFPVISERAMIAWATRVASWLWFTPMVHQKETRFPSWIRVASSTRASAERPVSATTSSRGKPATWARYSSKPLVWASMKARSIQPRSISRLPRP
jgi:hypothetical protein